MPNVRRISANEPEWSITANSIVSTNWDIAATRCLDFTTNRNQYADDVKYLPEAATQASDAESDMTNKTLDFDKTVNVFLVDVVNSQTKETWLSQKTISEMQFVAGVIPRVWAYVYISQDQEWYTILGRPSSEGFAWQLQAIFRNDPVIVSAIKTFKHDEYSEFRISANLMPLLLIVPSDDWEHWGGEDSEVGRHLFDAEVLIAIYQNVIGKHAQMGALERLVRQRMSDIVLIENPRFGDYLSEKEVTNPFGEPISKEIESWRGERFRKVVFTIHYRDKISNKANLRIY